MTNWQVQPPPDNDGHARRYNPDTGRTDPFLMGLLLFVVAIVGVSLFYGLRLVYRNIVTGIGFTLLTFAAAGLHFFTDVPNVAKGYGIIVLAPLLLAGFVAAVIDIWKYFDRKYTKENDEKEGR